MDLPVLVQVLDLLFAEPQELAKAVQGRGGVDGGHAAQQAVLTGPLWQGGGGGQARGPSHAVAHQQQRQGPCWCLGEEGVHQRVGRRTHVLHVVLEACVGEAASAVPKSRKVEAEGGDT